MIDENIEIVCYNHIEKWHNRKTALTFYKEAAQNCDGCESERYANIVWDLLDGKNVCHDGYSDSYEVLLLMGKFYETDARDGYRDTDGKIWFMTK